MRTDPRHHLTGGLDRDFSNRSRTLGVLNGVMERAGGGGESSREALRAFCTREHERLVGVLSLYTGDRNLAQDIAQEALARACADWPRVQRMDAPAAWLHRVALNLARSQFRRWRVARSKAHLLVPIAREADDPTAAIALRAAIAGLPERQRRALVLRFYADLPVRDVARLMRCPEGTVKSLTATAIASLRARGLTEAPPNRSEVSDAP